MTAPYIAAASSTIAGPHRQDMTARVTPATGQSFMLPIETASVTFDEDWSPHAQASLTVPVPTEEQVALLDARARVKVTLEAGYFHPFDLEHPDTHPLATLNLRARPIDRPSNTMTLSLQGDELYAQDAKNTSRAAAYPPSAGLSECIEWLIGRALAGFGRVFQSTIPTGYRPDLLEDLVVEPGDSWFEVAVDVASRAGVRLWCDPLGTWRIDTKPAYTDTAHEIVYGDGGTLISYNSILEREPWYNAVLLDYQFTKDGTNRRIYGTARVSAGPLSTTTAGYKTYTEQRSHGISQAAADAAATTLCASLATRGRSIELEAVSAYWLRPGTTFIASTGNGPRERWIASRVTFNFPSGTMNVKGRLPGAVTITSGE